MCVFYILSACLSVCVRLHLCVSLYLSVCESVMFSYATSFNGDIPKWDVSSVSVIHAILSYVTSFNGDIPKWDVSSLIALNVLLCDINNGDIPKRDVSTVSGMHTMLFMRHRSTAASQIGTCQV